MKCRRHATRNSSRPRPLKRNPACVHRQPVYLNGLCKVCYDRTFPLILLCQACGTNLETSMVE